MPEIVAGGAFFSRNPPPRRKAKDLSFKRRKSMKSPAVRHCCILTLFCCAALPALNSTFADEGMWTYADPPMKLLKQRYGFAPTREWLDHLRLASLRFNDGGSGSFISPTGLVLTNHHVALGQLQKVSTEKKNYVNEGFYAATPDQEMKAPDLEIDQLISMENVSRRVAESVKPGMTDAEAFKARAAEIAKIEKESMDATGLRSTVISLYGGAERWLYRYRKYIDVRLVFAPEQQTAYFGGDPDNFTYPRHDLDMAIFRIYENGKPISSPQYLKWNVVGAADGELVLVSGNPGSTRRMKTLHQIELERDVLLPLELKMLQRRLETLEQYSAKGTEPSREAAGEIFYIQNSIKSLTGERQGLLDKEIIARRQNGESEFRARIAATPDLKKKFGNVWKKIVQIDRKEQEKIKQLRFRSLDSTRLTGMALMIVRYVAQIKKPDGERLDGYHDAQLPSLRFRLFSPAPIYRQMDAMLLADSLKQSLEELGPKDPFVTAALQGRTPAEAAERAIHGTGLADPEVRKALINGGESAVAASKDPAIELARRVSPVITQTEEWYSKNILSVLAAEEEKLGLARFAAYGKNEYPDANFTLRLSFGVVKGYPMNGTLAPPVTTFYGLYDRAYSFGLRPPFNLTDRWMERKSKINLQTPINTVNTCDIVGGNSGSPVVNVKGELVGLIFDGNIESLVGTYIYDDRENRAVAVHSAGMMEALRRIYNASALADEIEAIGERPQ
jgi:hypothetical protein